MQLSSANRRSAYAAEYNENIYFLRISLPEDGGIPLFSLTATPDRRT